MTVLPQHILEHYEDPYHRGFCEHATHQAEANNAACGDALVVQLRVVDDKVTEAWFDGEGCHLSQAFASILIEKIEGLSLTELAKIERNDTIQDIDIELSDSQRACCGVAFDVMLAALNSPLYDFENGDGPTFNGPDLGDEC